MKKLTTLFVLFTISLAQNTRAQTTLSKGDIAFIAMQENSNLADTFAIVLLKDIVAGTQISFTDGNWNDANNYITLNNARSEWMFTWQATSSMTVGTKIKFYANTPGSGAGYEALTSTGNIVGGRALSLTIAGDQIFAFQGGTVDTTTNYRITNIPRFLAGIHLNVQSGITNDANWDNGVTVGTSTSELPDELITGTHAIRLDSSGVERQNAKFLGPCNSTSLSVLNDRANWSASNTPHNPSICFEAPLITSTTWNGTSWSNGTPTSTLDAIINSNTAPGSFTCKALTVNNGITLNVSNGSTVTVSSSTTNNGNIVVAPTGSFVSAAAVSNVTIQKSIIGQRGWRMFAYPFTTTQTFSSLATTNGIAISTTPSGASGLTDVRSFTNGTTNGWNNVTASSTTANTPFALFIRGLSSEVTGLNYTAGPSAFTFSVNGTLNASPFTVTPSASNFTLVGNPFAAPVNSSALTNGTGKSYYVYQISQGGNTTAQRTKAGAWSTVLSSSATTPIPTLGVIAYQAGNASSYTVSTNDINTTNAATTGLFSTEKAIEHLELRVLQNGMQLDNLFVRQDAASSEKGTDGKDLQKLTNEGLNVYTLTTADHHRLAVDARNVVGTTTIPLGVVGAVGNYTLQVANLNIEGVNVSLKDAFTNTTTALKANGNYDFAITTDATSKGENRFELVLNKVANSIAGIDVLNAGKMTAKLFNGNINRNNIAQLEIAGAAGKVEIRVTDMAGRLLHTQSGQNGRNTIQLGRKAGVQLITISDGTTTINQKMVKQ